jgi:hypothetical protein
LECVLYLFGTVLYIVVVLRVLKTLSRTKKSAVDWLPFYWNSNEMEAKHSNPANS